MIEIPNKILYITLILFVSLLICYFSMTTSVQNSIKNDNHNDVQNNIKNSNNYIMNAKNQKLSSSPPPLIRYEPSPFRRGQRFPGNHTPLTMIRDGLVRKNQQQQNLLLPPDWDGGYGWQFVKYHASPFENQWRRETKRYERMFPGVPLCDLQKNTFKRQFNIYFANLHRMTPDNLTSPFEKQNEERCRDGKFADEPQKFDDEVFSKFEYVFRCTRPPCRSAPPFHPKIGDRKFSYIEPLVGLLRYPKTCYDFYQHFLNKSYMIVDSWPLTHVSRSTISPKPKVIYLDGGASLWNSGGGGASQSWFHEIYARKCINITDWFMYEAIDTEPVSVFDLLPGHIKSGYRWYNIFLQTNESSWDNPNNALLLEAKKEDIVIFKIDFDSPEIEMALIEQILKYPQVYELIDELYFEHHCNMEYMRAAWQIDLTYPVWHSDSLRLFTALREKGIRAHSWV